MLTGLVEGIGRISSHQVVGQNVLVCPHQTTGESLLVTKTCVNTKKVLLRKRWMLSSAKPNKGQKL